MKKRLISLLSAVLLIILMLLPFSANAQSKYVVDEADLMTDSQEAELAQILEEMAEKYRFDAVALTVNTLDGKTPMEYADDYYDYNGYREDGCLFLISMEDRDWWISTKGYGITAITDYGISVIEGEVVPYLSDGDYYGGYKEYASIVESFIVEARYGTPYDTNHTYTTSSGYTYDNNSSSDDDDSDVSMGALIISFIVAIIIAAIITKMVKNSYKPVRFKASAQDYLVAGSLNVTRSYESFLYSNVSKTEIQESSSSGGGSSTHSSSSGSSHGGGGGKF
jgi:uncharacterized protein